eukprot:1131380-Prymnesium_polylepis.2
MTGMWCASFHRAPSLRCSLSAFRREPIDVDLSHVRQGARGSKCRPHAVTSDVCGARREMCWMRV